VLDLYLDDYLDMFELGLDFNMQVFDTYLLSDYILRFIIDMQKKENKDNQIHDLYNELKNYL
jgi:hypothetical protein